MSPEPGSPADAVAPRTGPSTLLIVHVYPHLLGTYGDAGNAIVLLRRALARAIPAEIVAVDPGERLPRAGDVYLLGGGEDAKQTAAAQELRDDGGLAVAAERGAAIFGVCAGYQLLGQTFLGVGGVEAPGLGLLDVRTGRLERRAVGNVLAEPSPGLDLPELIGFENHGGATRLGPDTEPLGRVRIGVGNGEGETEGAVQGAVYGTYLHGPALALNPALADRMLGHAVGRLPPIDDSLVDELRRHRLHHVLPATARAGRRRSFLGALRRHDPVADGATASLSTPAR